MKEKRKSMVGRVVSDKMQKTVVVRVESSHPHPHYHRIVRTSKQFKAHDEKSDSHTGDLVRIEECRPVSKEKSWRVAEVLQRKEVPEVRPQDIGREVEEGVADRGTEQ